MKKIFIMLAVTLLTACASPRYTGQSIDNLVTTKKPHVVVIRDAQTREGFLEVMTEWLKKNDYTYTVESSYAKHAPDNVTLEYKGHWKWDLALYLHNAEIEAYHGGQRIAEVTYRAPNSLNPNKFSSAETRITYLMDVLFGKLSATEATVSIK